MSNNAILAALRRMGIGKEEMTGHGFRAMARTILDVVLGFRPDFIEHQLAHAVRGPRGFPRRRRDRHCRQLRSTAQVGVLTDPALSQFRKQRLDQAAAVHGRRSHPSHHFSVSLPSNSTQPIPWATPSRRRISFDIEVIIRASAPDERGRRGGRPGHRP